MKFSPRTGVRSGFLAAAGLGSIVLGFLIAITPAIADLTTTTSSVATTTTSASVTTTSTTIPVATTTIPKAYVLPWPSGASAAVAIPSLEVNAASPSQKKMPIASLTKMMTAWVVLQNLPLTYSEKGPCIVVSAKDFAMYQYDLDSGQSNAKIALNEKLCEGTLLRGMLVHSAGDYAQLLIQMMGVSQAKFISMMNADAKTLGLSETHYVDFTGISPADTSTAKDQTTLAVDLMSNEQIVRKIVALTEVKLPVAGEVISYTPFEGQQGVVGVKSGYTTPAGGCDVMAVNYAVNGTVITLYMTVIGVHGAEAINRSGEDALVLAQYLKSRLRVVGGPSGNVVTWAGWSGYSSAPTTTSTTTSTTSTTTTPSSSTTTVAAG